MEKNESRESRRKRINKLKNRRRSMIVFIGLLLVVLISISIVNTNENSFITRVRNEFLANLNIYSSPIPEVDITSSDYNKPGSWDLKKTAKWTNKTTAEVSLYFSSVLKKQSDNKKDVIVVVDTSSSMYDEKLSKAKDALFSLTNNILSNNGNKMALISFDSSAVIQTGLSDNKDEIKTKISGLSSGVSTNYNAALKSVLTVLNNYKESSKRDLIVLFITDGEAVDETPNENVTYKIIKDKYPSIIINGIQYEGAPSIYKSLVNISDKQYSALQSNINNVLLSTANAADYFTTLNINEVIDDTYFNIKKVDTSTGVVSIDKNNINWKIGKINTGYDALMVINLEVKDRYKNEDSYFPISKKTEVDYKLVDDEKKNIDSQKTPVLKNYYEVTYKMNTPSDCRVEAIPKSTHIIYDNVDLNDDISCPGYIFKGWEIGDTVSQNNSSSFIMPEDDVVISGTWSKFSVNKSIDGKVHSSSKLYDVLKQEATDGNYASLYTGNHADALDASGSENIYYYRAKNDIDAPVILNKNNVIFANHCWQMLRTTDTGGVKIIYNGEPDENNSCSINRPNHVGYHSGYEGDEIYMDYNSYFYFGNDYYYNKSTGQFGLAGEKTSIQWNEANKDSVIGKYTCRSQNESEECSEIYYVIGFANDRNAVVIPIVNYANYSDFGIVNYNVGYDPAFVGYMYKYGVGHANGINLAGRGFISASRFSGSVSYYYADGYTYNETTKKYTLTNPRKVSYSELNNLDGKYTFRSSSSNYTTSYVYYIYKGPDNNLYYLTLTNGKTPEEVKTTYIFGNSYIDNGDGTYTITDQIRILEDEWTTRYNEVANGKYFCPQPTYETCSYQPRTTISADSNYYYYLTNKYIYGNSFEYKYNNESGKYEYYLKDTISSDSILTMEEMNNHRYICSDGSDHCEEVMFIIYFNPTEKSIYYNTAVGGKTMKEIVDDTYHGLNVNTFESDIKMATDEWYKHYMINYTPYIEDTVYCNNRKIVNYHGYSMDNGLEDYPSIDFMTENPSLDLSCTNVTDKFSLNNNFAKLKYPVGLATAPEMNLLNNDNLRKTGNMYWLMSPSSYGTFPNISLIYDDGYIDSRTAEQYAGLRPVISLKPGIEYTDGNGSMEHPYIIETEMD